MNLLTPTAWKKFDPGWIITSSGEVKLDSEKETRLKAVAVKDGPVWLNGEKGACRISLQSGPSATARSTSSS